MNLGLEVSGVSVVYDNGFQALTDVSVTAERGKFITLLGPSGCGKTTLLKTIAGFITPTQGTVSITGEDVTALTPEKRDTAMVFQSYALFPHMTVADNVEFGLKQRKVPKAERADRVDDALAYVSMTNQRDKRPKQMSGGQQQRVALARAIALRPDVVLYDEPLSNLDAKLRDQVRFELLRLQRDHGYTSIYVTHDQAEALAMSDTVYLMNGGVIAQAGAPHEIYYAPETRFVADFLGVANIFEAEISGGSDRLITVQSRYGELQVAVDERPKADRIWACWRPEQARVVAYSDAEETNTFEIEVVASTFLGNLTDVLGNLPGATDQQFRIQLLGFHDIRTGQRLRLKLQPNDIRLLEPIE